MEAEKINDVNFLITFSQLNLDVLSDLDMQKLELDAEHYFFQATRTDDGHAGVVQGEGEGSIDRLPPRGTAAFRDLLKRIQPLIWDRLIRMTGVGEGGEAPLRDVIGRSILSLKVGSENFSLAIDPFPLKAEDRAIISLYKSLDGVPLGSFRQCPECKKIFFVPSKRVKIFCSSNCIWRFNARKLRDDQEKKKKYNEKQKEIMKKKYEKKKREKHGDDIYEVVEAARKSKQDTENKG
jgi:hypothetical protein